MSNSLNSNAKTFSLTLLPGDGIGPEVVSAAIRVLDLVADRRGFKVNYSEYPIGGCSIDLHGTALTEDTLKACKSTDAVLLGAVGGPKWDDPAAPVRPEQGLLALRKGMGVFANLRPVAVHPALVEASPLKPERLQGVDLLFVRELTGGLYFGQPKRRDLVNDSQHAVDTLEYFDYEIERVVDLAFSLARRRRQKLTVVDKANVLESSRLWRQITSQVARGYPDISLDYMLVDTASMRLVTNPAQFDVIVTENMFGDILTDEASVLAGSMGMLPSASLSKNGPGLFEPIHGSAPDIAGLGIANPLGTILSTALMLRYTFLMEKEATSIEAAVHNTIAAGCRTADLGGRMSTNQMTQAVLKHLEDCL